MVASGTQDYVAAMEEIHSNLEVRRLMFVFFHVLLPGSVVALSDALSSTNLPPEIAWWPKVIVPLTGLLIAASGIVVCTVLARCHFGMVVNSTKMLAVADGEAVQLGLNWRGVTTNFVALTGLSAAAGLAFLAAGFLPTWIALVLAAILFALVFAQLLWNHRRANELAQRLVPNWEHASIPRDLQERHEVKSLGGANGDVSIVVTMAAALFIGFFTAMAKIGGINPDLDLPPRVLDLWQLPVFAGFLLGSLLLSARMIARIRLAIGEHSIRLAKLRNEPDDPWRFRLQERTFLLFLLVELLIAFTATVLGWSLFGAVAGVVAGLVLLGLGVFGYAMTLQLGRKKHPPTTAA